MTHSCKAMTVRGNEQAKRYLDVDELTSQSGLSHATIWRLKAAGKIPFYQPAGKGGRVTFPPDALERTGQNEAPAFPQDAADSSPSKQLPGPRPQWMSSLGTRDREDALRRLRDLDRYKAIEHGLVQPDRPAPSEDVGIDDGWRLYMERCEQP